MKVGELYAVLGLKDDGFDSGLDRAHNKLGGVGMLAVKAAAKTATAMAAGAVASLAAFSGFERGMNEVFTLLPGITDEAMSSMSSRVLDFSRDFGTLPNEVIPALYQAISAGVPKKNVFDFLETAQKAAIGGVTDLQTAVDGISSVVNAYGEDVLSAAEASDLMFTAVRMGKTDFGQLSASLFQVIPTASALGVGFGDVTAALSTLTAQGTPTSVATTQMRQMFVELSKEGSNTSKVFKEIAGESFRDFIDGGGNVQEALKLLEKHADDTGVGVNDLFGSVEAGAAALGLTGKSAKRFTENLEEMAESAGATDEAYKTMDEGIGRSFDRIKTAIVTAAIEMGETLAPAAAAMADWFVANMPAIQEAVGNAFSAIGGFVNDVVIPAFQAVADWWASNGPTVIEAVAVVVDAIVEGFRAASDAVQWVIDKWGEIEPIITIVAGLITAVMIPHWAALATAATVSAITQVGAWVMTQVAAVTAAVIHSAQVLLMIAKWALLAPTAIGYAGLVVGAWVMTQLGAIKAAAVHAVQVAAHIAKWVVLSAGAALHAAKVVAAWVITQAGAIAAVVVMVAQSAVFVARWAFVGVQSLIHAAKVALAWVVAMGPVAWAIALVVAFAAVVVHNWDTIRNVIETTWRIVNAATRAAWNQIKTAVTGAVANVISTMQGMPGRILSAVGSLGGLLHGAGVALVQGLSDGITSRMSSLIATASSMAATVANTVRSALLIRSPSRVFFDIGGQITAGMVQGIDGGTAAIVRSLQAMTKKAREAAVTGVQEILSAINAQSAAITAGNGIGDARAALRDIRREKRKLPEDIEGAQKELARLRGEAKEITVEEELDILRARQAAADKLAAYNLLQQEGTATTDELRTSQLEWQVAQRAANEVARDAVRYTQDVYEAEQHLADLRERARGITADEEAARQNLLASQTQALAAQLELVTSTRDVGKVSKATKTLLGQLAEQMDISGAAVRRLIAALSTPVAPVQVSEPAGKGKGGKGDGGKGGGKKSASVQFGDVHLHDGVDVDMLAERLDFALTSVAG